jgi:hypothetical protein
LISLDKSWFSTMSQSRLSILTVWRGHLDTLKKDISTLWKRTSRHAETSWSPLFRQLRPPSLEQSVFSFLSFKSPHSICLANVTALSFEECERSVRRKSVQNVIQWTSLNRIILGQSITDPSNQMMPISKGISTYIRHDRVIWDF